MAKHFEAIFLKLNRNEIALNSFLACKLLTHDFGGAIVFISVDSEVKRKFTDVSKDVHIGLTEEETDTNITVHLKHCFLNVSEMMQLKQLIPML